MQPVEPVLMSMTSYHLEDVAAIERACFSDPWGYEALASELNQPMAHYLVLASPKGCVGFCGGLDICGEFEITTVAVAPDAQRKGYGTRLLEGLIACARSLGDERMHLEVRASNAAAIALYTRFGFRKTGLRRGYYAFSQEDAVLMTLELAGSAKQNSPEQKESDT